MLLREGSIQQRVAPDSREGCESRAERGASKRYSVLTSAAVRKIWPKIACSFRVRKNRSQTPFVSGWCGKASGYEATPLLCQHNMLGRMIEALLAQRACMGLAPGCTAGENPAVTK